jgi:hypothetical protein
MGEFWIWNPYKTLIRTSELFCVCLKRVGWVLFGAAEYDGVVIGSGC